MTINLYDLTRNQIISLVSGWGFSQYHADLLWAYLYRHYVNSFADMQRLSADFLARLEEETLLYRPPIAASVGSSDGLTQKYLLTLHDGESVETVLMRYPRRSTACISTQVGCAMGCVFCATGQMGFTRQLSGGEIVAQVLHLMQVLRHEGDTINNLVFMGMGEPLHNYEATVTAIDILTDDKGLAIAPRRITLSTIGLPPFIRRLADDEIPVNLAVSLHAATDNDRSLLVPINRRWPIKELLDACRYYIQKRGRRIFFEWTLIDGHNDEIDEAHTLGRLLQGMDAHVNLIPLNPTRNFDGQPSQEVVARRFQSTLAGYGVPSTIRQRRGIDIDAGCGQLRSTMNSRLNA